MSVSSTRIDDWRKGQKPSAGHLNQPLPTVRSVQRIVGRGGVRVAQGPSSTSISNEGEGRYLDHWIGKVVAAGPNGEGDYTDERYWVQRQYLNGGDSSDAVETSDYVAPKATIYDGISANGTQVDAHPVIWTVTNLDDALSGKHSLPAGMMMHVFGFRDRQHDARIRYVTSTAKPSVIPCALASTSGAAGSSSTAATWVYTATDILTSAQIGTGLSPTVRIWPRKAAAATYGHGYFDASGTFVLLQAYEVQGRGSC